jgi:hypothetical protein
LVSPAIPEVGAEKPASVGGFYPFVPGGIAISFDTVLMLSLKTENIVHGYFS